jgi:hypothetical protein
LIGGKFPNRLTAAQLTMIPAWLTALVGKQASLTNLSGGQKLLVHHND